MTWDPAPVLWICGAVGAGKSSVGYQVFRLVLADGLKAAYIDFDQIGMCYPESDDDPENHRLKAANLGAMWPNFRAAGAQCLIASGTADNRDVIPIYTNAVPGAVFTTCRLRASAEEITRRIFLRGGGGGPVVPGDELRNESFQRLSQVAEASVQNAEELERDGIGDLCVDTDHRSITEVAELVRATAKAWPG